MRKFIYLIICIFLLTGCGKYSEKDVVKDIKKEMEDSNSYKLKGELEISNNDDIYNYDIDKNVRKFS